MGLEFIVFLYYPFSVNGIYSKMASFIPDISNLCLLSFSFFSLFYFWLCWVFVAARGLFSSFGERELVFLVMRGLLIAGGFSSGFRHAGFSSCGTRAQQLWLVGSRAQAQ